MTVKVLYFSWIKEKIGTGEESLPLPDSVQTVDDLVTWLKTQSSGHEAAFNEIEKVRVAIDQVHVPFSANVTGAAEIAFFPPVTGG